MNSRLAQTTPAYASVRFITIYVRSRQLEEERKLEYFIFFIARR